MLAYYVPALRGVDIRTGDSGTFDDNLWVGHYPAMIGQVLDAISMVNGKVVDADPDQVLMRRAPLSAVVLESAMTDTDSAVWRWKTEEEIKADSDVEKEEQASAEAAMVEAEAAYEESQKKLEVVTPETLSGLRDALIKVINARFPERPVTIEEIDAAVADAVSAQIAVKKVEITPKPSPVVVI